MVEFEINQRISKGMKALGDTWTLQIMDVLMKKDSRFNELLKAVDGISPSMLVHRLKKLQSLHMITRSEETINKHSVVYSLTARGRGMKPVLHELNEFINKYM